MTELQKKFLHDMGMLKAIHHLQLYQYLCGARQLQLARGIGESEYHQLCNYLQISEVEALHCLKWLERHDALVSSTGCHWSAMEQLKKEGALNHVMRASLLKTQATKKRG